MEGLPFFLVCILPPIVGLTIIVLIVKAIKKAIRMWRKIK